ncbi:MAG: hypothetical protein QM771_17655 [Nitrospira sp.]
MGVRFLVAQTLSVDISVQYSQYGVDFRGEAGQAQQWVILIWRAVLIKSSR